jgi:hypothetical protein
MKRTSLLLVSLLITLSSWAYDFKSGNLFYTITSNTSPYTVSVTNDTINFSISGSVSIPSTVTNGGKTYTVTAIGENAFLYCRSMTAISLPNTLISIENFAFYDCESLASVSIPATVTYIGEDAFSACSAMTSYTVNASNALFSSDNGVLLNKSKTTVINSPGGKTGTYTIPSTITTLRSASFLGCHQLTSVSIPSSVTIMHDSIFEGCWGLTSLYVYKTTPIDLSAFKFVFYNVNTSTCVLHVPVGSKSLYAKANLWQDFTNIVEDLTNPVYNAKSSNVKITTTNEKAIISGLPQGETVSVYNLQGAVIYSQKVTSDEVSVSLPTHGLYIVKVGSESVKVIY